MVLDPGQLLSGLVFLLGVMLSADESCNGDRGSIALPYKHIGEMGTVGGVCIKCTDTVNICYIAQVSAESWSDLIFVESSGMS